MPHQALRCGLTTSARADFGSAAALDNMTALTIILLSRPYMTPTAGRALVSKGSSTINPSFRVSTSNQLQFVWGRATTDLTYTTTDVAGTRPFDHVGHIGFKWFVCRVDQAGSAGALAKIQTGRLGSRGKVPVLYTHTIASPADGSGAFDDDSASSLWLGADPNATNSAQIDHAFFMLFSSYLSDTDLFRAMKNPMALRHNAKILAFPGMNGSRYVKNWAGHPTPAANGVITGATPMTGPLWLPWEQAAFDADNSEAVGAPAATNSGLLGDGGLVNSDLLFDGSLIN